MNPSSVKGYGPVIDQLTVEGLRHLSVIPYSNGVFALVEELGLTYTLRPAFGVDNGTTCLDTLDDITRQWGAVNVGIIPPPGPPAPVTQTLSADTNVVTFAGLNGDTDNAIYEIEANIKYGVGSTYAGGNLVFKPNDAAIANQKAQYLFIFGTDNSAGIAADGPGVNPFIGLEGVAGSTGYLNIRFFPQTGHRRILKVNYSIFDPTTDGQISGFYGFLYWNDTATPIASISLADATHNFWGAGSVITMRKIPLS